MARYPELPTRYLLCRVLEPLGPYIVGTWGVRVYYMFQSSKNPTRRWALCAWHPISRQAVSWGSLKHKNPKGPCTQIVHTLAPKYLYLGTTLRPKYILFGYMDPWGKTICLSDPAHSHQDMAVQAENLTLLAAAGAGRP